MTKAKLYFIYSIIIVILISSVYFGYQIYPIETTKDRIDFIVTVTSLFISLFAFLIAMNTYISIDSVNRVTQLTGNVLENENYITSLASLLTHYDGRDSIETRDAIFIDLERKFHKESKTAIEFANNLQYFIDVIVFFPALFSNGEKRENISRMDHLLEIIEKKKKTFLAIGTGNLTLIEETVKLIQGVMAYQKLISDKNYDVPPSLLQVRGTMLKNSVTLTVYYNYLGLFYNKKAMFVLNEKLDLVENDFFDIRVHRKLIKQLELLNDEDLELISIYLHESKKAFQQAIKHSEGDVMWEGFIKYNDARTTYFLQLIFPEEKQANWKETMDVAIIARKRLNMLIKDILKNDTYLQEHFYYQEYIAKLVKINILIARGEDITDSRGYVKYSAPDYLGLMEGQLIKKTYMGSFKKITRYQEKIRELIKTHDQTLD